MTVAVVVFPGTNCERDVMRALRLAGAGAELVWHRDSDLSGAAGVVLPGGFAHGDYLRTGAIARFSPVMTEVARLAAAGRPVLGICNGFQILCEAGLLPGALIANRDLRFICRWVQVRVEDPHTVLTRGAEEGAVLRLPLNSYEGCYVPDPAAAPPRVALRYCGPAGEMGEEHNPNGSTDAIAGIAGPEGNVGALMPHPERAVEEMLGSTDGRVVIDGFVASLEMAGV